VSVPFTGEELLQWTGGRGVGASLAGSHFTGVSINTRTLAPGELFVAIRGEVHDAHRFLSNAAEGGAGGLMVEEAWLEENALPGEVSGVAVADTTAALGALAAGYRTRFEGPVVAITGSNGKTTTKEMCHRILSVAAPCLKNEGNLNNEFGLPLTLLSREPEQRAAVVELGMNHRGEIARLAAIARPDVGVITNIGTAHIEYLGSREEIAREKADLIAALGEDGVAVLNRDDDYVMSQAERAPGRVLTYGRSAEADVHANDVRFEDGGVYAFRLCSPQGDTAIRIHGLAETTVINALAAGAAALAAGASLEAVAQGLGRHDQVPGRMACRELSDGVCVIDDTYNANPQSMKNALESLARLKGAGRGFAVLGDMGELGEAAESAHRDTGRIAAQQGVDFLFALGERAELVAEGAREAGMEASRVLVGKTPEELCDGVRERMGAGDWILVKGSRAMRMERVVEALVTGENA
jgi:UDP-N-acetylmuramoyl-tripeptide--D-alanyl-D-alanine ligase